MRYFLTVTFTSLAILLPLLGLQAEEPDKTAQYNQRVSIAAGVWRDCIMQNRKPTNAQCSLEFAVILESIKKAFPEQEAAMDEAVKKAVEDYLKTKKPVKTGSRKPLIWM